MIRRLIGLLILGVLANEAEAQTVSSRFFHETLQWRILEATFRLSTQDGIGSGVVVAYSPEKALLLITANHVVAGFEHCKAERFTKASYPKAQTVFPKASVVAR